MYSSIQPSHVCLTGNTKYSLIVVLLSAVQCERSQNMSKDKQMDPVGPFQSKLAERCDFAFNMEFPEDKQLTMDYVYELATRLLFHSIDWVRFTHSFNKLNPNDQVILLKSCWTDVFLLSFVQCAKVCPLEATLNLMKQNTEKGGNESNQEMNMVNYINKVIDLLLTLERLDLTATEFALLKLICLFNPGMYCTFCMIYIILWLGTVCVRSR